MESNNLKEKDILEETVTEVVVGLKEIANSCNAIKNDYIELLKKFNGKEGVEIFKMFQKSVLVNERVDYSVKEYVKKLDLEEDVFMNSLDKLHFSILGITNYLSTIDGKKFEPYEEFSSNCQVFHNELKNLKIFNFMLHYIGLGYVETEYMRTEVNSLANAITTNILNEFKILEMKILFYFHSKKQ